MRLLSILAAIFFCAMSLSSATVAAEEAKAHRYPIQGTVSWKGDTIALKTAIVRWDPRSRELQIGLFPFEVTDEDAEKVRKWRMMMYATVGKPSPDAQKFPKAPYLVAALGFKDAKDGYRAADAVRYALNVIDWKKPGTTATFLSGGDVQNIVKQLQFAPGKIADAKFHLHETADRVKLEGFRYEAKN